ncbi:MAG: glycosyltransferase family 4 protein [Candidatus Eisenbacteria bacterium]|nr:glycosyltransferase family 4 protein [Candidatus Eisenbacteria bacterium]
MRLCYVADLKSSHTVRWVSYFARRGHSVLVLSPASARVPGVRVRKIFRTPTLPKLIQLLNVFPVVCAVASFRPHVLHAHYARIYGWLAALAFFKPLVVTVWGGDILEDQGAFSDFFGRTLTPYALRRADLVTAHSGYLRDKVVALGVRRTAVEMVGCPGVDRSTFKPGLDTRALRRELRLADGPVVFCPRIIGPLYNTETIVRAIPEILCEVPDARFVFSEHMGDGLHIAAVKNLAAELGVADAAVFVQSIPHDLMPSYFNLARVLVSIPDSDGMPQSLLEAMACGTVPVVSDLPQYEGVVRDGVNALTVDRKDPSSLAKAVIRLLKDDGLRAGLSRAAAETTAEGADYEVEMAKMERLYLSLADRR